MTTASATFRRNAWLIFAARGLRMFGFGFISVILVLYLAALGLSDAAIGALLTLTLLGDAAISLWLTTHADRVGRRRVLLAGALLMSLGGVAFATSDAFAVLAVAATIGVISPSGGEVGPFLAVEQASLAQTVGDERRTRVLAWFNLVASFAKAGGTLAGGAAAGLLIAVGLHEVEAYRLVLVAYALLGLVLVLIVSQISPAVETAVVAPAQARRRLGLHGSTRIVTRLSALFALDSFAGAFVVQSLIAYWFVVRFDADPALIGAVLSAANLLAGLSALLAARLADRVGLIRTMVFTHLPSNVLLICVPFMPTLGLAVAVLLVRYSISQMDVPARQSYIMAVVHPDERSAAAGITTIARSVGAALAPLASAPLIGGVALASLPFVISGSLKIVYDVLLYAGFRSRPESPQAVAPDGAGAAGEAA